MLEPGTVPRNTELHVSTIGLRRRALVLGALVRELVLEEECEEAERKRENARACARESGATTKG